MASEDNENAWVGCLPLMWSLCVTTPIWLTLMFAIMSANEMPTWSWVLYWVYVPSTVLGTILFSMANVIMKAKK